MSQIPEKIGMSDSLAYKRWSLTIAEDRGDPDFFGVTSGVTLGPPLSYPGAISLMRKVSTKAVFQPFQLSVADLNSSSYAELELADRES